MSQGSPTETFGPYLVYEQLGVGGMAQVHRAIVMQGGAREVALKRMLSHIADNEDMVKSFVREARLASYLRHKNVAETYELGRVGEIYFIVMELITGRNLREVLKHCGATTGPMPVPIALNILNQICDALDYAHNLSDETGQPLGIIHRDVSPSNIIVSESGIVKLIDFGIAKASAAGMQTMSGTLKGKFGYMAPEYIAGRIDARADLFALGVIAHELLTNRPLFTGRDDVDTLQRVRDMHIEPPSVKNPYVPAEIDDVVMTALSRDPERRWQHATALRNALTTLTHRLGLVATNAEMIRWLDWAFAQTLNNLRAAPPSDDDDDDDDAILELPGSINQQTVDLARQSQRMTLVIRGKPPSGPMPVPVGTARIPVPDVEQAQTLAYHRPVFPIPPPRASEDVMPTLVRPSMPRMSAQVPRASEPGPGPIVPTVPFRKPAPDPPTIPIRREARPSAPPAPAPQPFIPPPAEQRLAPPAPERGPSISRTSSRRATVAVLLVLVLAALAGIGVILVT